MLCEHSPPCGGRKSFGMLSHLILAFSTAAVLAPCLHLPPAAATREPQRATLVGITRKPRGKPAPKQKENQPKGLVFFLVAERGLDPPDLRVMSPTSYHLLHSAILIFRAIAHSARANTPRHRRIVVCSRHSARHTPCFGGFGFVKTRPRRFFTRLPNEYHLLHSAIYRARPPRVPHAARLGSLSRHLHDALSGAGDRGRTGTILSYQRILSPWRLPVPPHRQDKEPRFLRTLIISYILRFVNTFDDFFRFFHLHFFIRALSL